MKLKRLIFSCLAFLLPAVAIAQGRDTHERLNAILWVQTSAEYETICMQTYRQAWNQVENMLSQADSGFGVPSAAIEQPGFNTNNLPYAVIMDIDETVLDNSPMSGRLIESRSGYTAENWSKWVDKESADFIPGAEEFINKVRAANIELIFVTNRTENEEAHTIEDLEPIVVTDSQILAKDEKESSSSEPWPSEKSSRREHIAKKYWIIGMIGDDLADFIPNIKSLPPEQRIIEAGKYQQRLGSQWFLLPNPVYGSWETVLYKRNDSDQKQLQDKIKKIKSYQKNP